MYFWSVSLFGIPIVRSISYFFGIPNFFGSTKLFFWSTKFLFGIPKFQNYFWYTKIVFGRPKKLEIDRTIAIPKRLTKSTWTPLMNENLILIETWNKLLLYLGATFVLQFFATIQLPTSASELRKVLRNIDALFAGLKLKFS